MATAPERRRARKTRTERKECQAFSCHLYQNTRTPNNMTPFGTGKKILTIRHTIRLFSSMGIDKNCTIWERGDLVLSINCRYTWGDQSVRRFSVYAEKSTCATSSANIRLDAD